MVTDQTMPELTGRDMIARMRHIKPEQAVVLVTGYSETMNSAIAEDLNIDYIQKPFKTDDLLRLMHESISRAGNAD